MIEFNRINSIRFSKRHDSTPKDHLKVNKITKLQSSMAIKSELLVFCLIASHVSTLLACGLTDCGVNNGDYVTVPMNEWPYGSCRFSVCSFNFNTDYHDIVFDLFMPNGVYYNDLGILLTINGDSPATGNYSVYCPYSNDRCFVTISGTEFQYYSAKRGVQGYITVDNLLIYTTGNSLSSYYYLYNVGIALRGSLSKSYRQIWPPIANAMSDTYCPDCNLFYTFPPYAAAPVSSCTAGNSPSASYGTTPLSIASPASSPSSADTSGYSATADLDASVIRKETGLLVGVLVPLLSAVVVSAVLIPVGIWVARSKSSKSLVKGAASMTVFNPTQSTPTPENKTTTVVTSHTASSGEEISVQKGDVVTVLDANEEDYWIVEIDGKVGLVPVTCLAK